jgi:hypothetical protein
VRPGGLPETVDEAQPVVNETAAINFNTHRPARYPEAQIAALSIIVQDQAARLAKLEAKPKRGRPPKAVVAPDKALVDTNIRNLGSAKAI